MVSKRVWRLVLAGLVMGGLLAMAGMDARAGSARAKRKALKVEVAELRGRLAKLEQDLDTYVRRSDSVGGGVTFPAPGGGFCGDPCATDSDEDGIGDCEDLCPCDPANVDGDEDGVPDCVDPCPDDATDACIDPCRMDSDGDGIVDCEDECPWDPTPATDGDEDGLADCADPCPDDPQNVCFGPCTLDADGDDASDCIDICPWGEGTNAPCFYQAPTSSGD